jgi:hypothetical protein
MTLEPIRFVLHCPLQDTAALVAFVETCVDDGADMIATIGSDCEEVHDRIDDILIGDGSTDEGRFIVTTWHKDETLEDVIEFVSDFGTHKGIIRQVRI